MSSWRNVLGPQPQWRFFLEFWKNTHFLHFDVTCASFCGWLKVWAGFLSITGSRKAGRVGERVRSADYSRRPRDASEHLAGRSEGSLMGKDRQPLKLPRSPQNWMFRLIAHYQTGCLPTKNERHLWTKIEHTKGNFSLTVSSSIPYAKAEVSLAEALLRVSTLVTHLLHPLVSPGSYSQRFPLYLRLSIWHDAWGCSSHFVTMRWWAQG